MAAIAACEAAGAQITYYLSIKRSNLNAIHFSIITELLSLIGNDTSTSANTYTYFHNFSVLGVQVAMVNQQTALPTGIDTCASCGVEIRQAQFLTFDIGLIAALKKYGV